MDILFDNVLEFKTQKFQYEHLVYVSKLIGKLNSFEMLLLTFVQFMVVQILEMDIVLYIDQ